MAFRLILAIATATVLNAQDANVSGYKVQYIPPPEPLDAHTPFSLVRDGHPLEVEIRPASEMSEQDRNLEADAESSIHEHATVQDFNVGDRQGQWSYSQVACHTFPGHLFLRFTRNSGAGDVSVFSVSVPRNGNGRVRFIPLQRRGYSLFSPTPVNAITVAVFNRILTEERGDVNGSGDRPDWPSMALCYAALAGAGGVTTQPVTILHPPVLNLSLEGNADIAFITGEEHPTEWKMIFDRRGILKKATRSSANEEQVLYPKPESPEVAKPVPPDWNLSTAQQPAPQQ